MLNKGKIGDIIISKNKRLKLVKIWATDKKGKLVLIDYPNGTK